jgi:hypothetical protein
MSATGKNKKKTWSPKSASELYRPSDCRLSAKLVVKIADREVSRSQHGRSYARFLGFLDRNRYFIFQVALQLQSRRWGDPVPELLRLRKFGSVGNRTRNSGSVASQSVVH